MALLPAGRKAKTALADVPSRFASLPGLRVHYKTVGRGGPVLLCAHGWACDLTFWRYTADDFAGEATLLLVDLPGHGRSDKPAVDYTHDLLARALHAVLDDAGHERAVLVGHSVGGTVARQFVRRFPDRAQALVLADANLLPFWDDARDRDELLELLAGPEYLKAAAGLAESMTAHHTPLLSGLEIRMRMLVTPQHVMRSVLAQMADPELWREDEIAVPVLALLSRSTRYSDAYEAFLRRVAPRLHLRWLEGAGHFLMLSQPDEFGAQLRAFLNAQGLLGPAHA